MVETGLLSCVFFMYSTVFFNFIIFRQCNNFLPGTLTTLSLNDNVMTELRDMSHLAHLSRLEQLSISDNPCIAQSDEIEKQFDYRQSLIATTKLGRDAQTYCNK